MESICFYYFRTIFCSFITTFVASTKIVHIMKLRTVIYSLLLATLCMGCGGHGHMRQLERLEAQLDTAPDVVRLALDSIPLGELNGEARALYAILRTQADYKCDVPLTTDTLMHQVVNYYHTSHPDYRGAMAYYSLGCIYTELGDDARAIRAYLQAQNLFPDTTVRYYRLCYQNLGRHYMNKGMYDEALEAFTLLRNAPVDNDTAYVDLNIACIYTRRGDYLYAESILTDILEKTIDSLYIANAHFELGKIEYTYKKDYAKAKDHFLTVIKLLDDVSKGNAYWFLGDMASIQGDKEAASNYFQMALANSADLYTSYNSARGLMYLAIDSIDNPVAYRYVKLFEALYDSINHHERQSEIIDIVNEHELLLVQKEIIEKHQRTVNMIIIAILIMIAVSVVLFLQFRNRRLHSILQLQEELRANQAELRKLRESTETISVDACSQQRLQVLYRKNLTGGIELFKRETKWINLLRRIETGDENVITGFSKSDGDKLRTALYRCFAESIENLQSEGHGVKSEDVVYCLLSAMGYSNRIIATCMAVSETAIRSRKSRMKDKIPSNLLELFF